MFGKSSQENYADIRPWVKTAVAEEDANPPDQLWKNEPSAKTILQKHEKRVRFLRKHGKRDLKARDLADRLESCHPRRRCLSGACAQCAQLLQRWFVRQLKKFIARHIETAEGKMIAITIVPIDSTVEPGELRSLSIANFQRRIKHALRKEKIQVAIGAVDFSFNEDKKGKYEPFWAPHLYVITSATNKKVLKDELAKQFPEDVIIPRPIKITPFRNRAYRCSYALKTNFVRRIGYDQKKKKHDRIRKCRNTSRDKLRAQERLELFLFLNQIGLATRPFFIGVKPHLRSKRVRLQRWG
jgi:hypothetical protein